MEYDFLATINNEKDVLQLSVYASDTTDTNVTESYLLKIEYGSFFGVKYPKFEVIYSVDEFQKINLLDTDSRFRDITEFAKAFLAFPGLKKNVNSDGDRAEISEDARQLMNKFTGFAEVQASGESIGYVEDWEPKTVTEKIAVEKAQKAASELLHLNMIDFALDTRNYELFMQLTSEKSNA